MTELIAELTRLEKSALPGPWCDEAEPNAPLGDNSRAIVTEWTHGQLESRIRIACLCSSACGRWVHIRPEDAALIVALRNALPQILKALTREERLVDALEKCVGVMEKNIYPKPDVGPDHPYSVLREAREALETPHAK